MTAMDSEFWFGLLLGGLLGVAFDLFKRPLDRLLDRRLAHRTATRAEAIEAQVKANSGSLRDYLVEVILQTTLIGSLIGIFSGILFGLGNLAYSTGLPQLTGSMLTTGGQIFAIGGGAYIVRVAGDALVVARRINPTS